jgi:hypothetical protein
VAQVVCKCKVLSSNLSTTKKFKQKKKKKEEKGKKKIIFITLEEGKRLS